MPNIIVMKFPSVINFCGEVFSVYYDIMIVISSNEAWKLLKDKQSPFESELNPIYTTLMCYFGFIVLIKLKGFVLTVAMHFFFVSFLQDETFYSLSLQQYAVIIAMNRQLNKNNYLKGKKGYQSAF